MTSHLPPTAKKVPKITNFHGKKITDNYFWLREKSNPSVRAYLEEENAYTDAVMKPTEALQKNLYHKILINTRNMCKNKNNYTNS